VALTVAIRHRRSITLKAYVASGQLRYVLLGSGGGPGGRGSSAITGWVTANGSVVSDVGNGSLYDLAGAV